MKTLQSALALLVTLALGLGVWTACDTVGTAPGDDVEGRFTLRLTDAPADVDSVVVTIDRVDLVAADDEDDGADNGDGDEDDGNGDEDSDDNGDGDDEETGIITLTNETRQLDLLQLQDGVTETLADVTVPEGTYTQLRLVLGAENYVVVDGEHQPLQVPSGMQSGIKIILPDGVEVEDDGDQIDLTLDFDVDESLIRAGASGRYLFRPTVKVKSVSVNGDDMETVEVEGAVSAADASGETVTVDGISFAVTDDTEFDGEDDTSSPADLQLGQAVEVSGTLRDDGSLAAREIDVEEGDDAERSITAPVESLGAQSLTLLGVSIDVTDETEIEDDADLSDLSVGDRVEVEYTLLGTTRTATEIEREDD